MNILFADFWIYVKNIFILYNSKIRIDFQLHKEVNCQKYCP